MSHFSPIQLKTIDEYRASHNLGNVISNEEVAKRIVAEMEALGVSYKGFETLIMESESLGVAEKSDKSVFGYGFNTDCNSGFELDLSFEIKEPSEQEKIVKAILKNSKWNKDWGGENLLAELDKITSNNIVDVLNEFDKVSQEKNLILTIANNSLIPTEKKKDAITKLFTILCNLAKTKEIDTSHFEKVFESNISQTKIQTNLSATGMSGASQERDILTKENLAIINSIIIGLKKSIEIKDNPDLLNTLTLILTPEEEIQARVLGSLEYKYSSCLEELEQQDRYDGFAGEFADWVSGAWGSKNREKHVRADLEHFNNQITSLRNSIVISPKEFEKKFEKIFGIKYNPEFIVNYQNVEQVYKMATSCYQLEEFFKSDMNVLLSNGTLQEEVKTRSIDPMTNLTQTTVLATKEQVFEREFNKLATFLGEGDLKKGKLQLEDIFKTSGITEASTLQDKYTVLRKVAQDYANVLHENTMQVTDNKGYVAISKEFDEAYKSAFGVTNDIARRVIEYNISQQAGAGVVKGALMLGGTITLGAITGGAGLAFFPTLALTSAEAGAVTALTEFSDRLTSGYVFKGFKENGIEGLKDGVKQALPDEEIIRILKSTGISSLAVAAGGLLGAGVEIGAASIEKTLLARALRAGKSTVDISKAVLLGKTVLHIGVGTGVGAGAEYMHVGEISIGGVVFAFALSAIGQVVALNKIGVADNGKVIFDKQAIEQARKELGIADDVVLTEKVLKKAYRERSFQTHPDHGGTKEAFSQTSMAYELLKKYAQTTTAVAPVKSEVNPATTPKTENIQNLPAIVQNNIPANSSVANTNTSISLSPMANAIIEKINLATTRGELRETVFHEIKGMQAGSEKEFLQEQYLIKLDKINRKYNSEFDIQAVYRPENTLSNNENASSLPISNEGSGKISLGQRMKNLAKKEKFLLSYKVDRMRDGLGFNSYGFTTEQKILIDKILEKNPDIDLSGSHIADLIHIFNNIEIEIYSSMVAKYVNSEAIELFNDGLERLLQLGQNNRKQKTFNNLCDSILKANLTPEELAMVLRLDQSVKLQSYKYFDELTSVIPLIKGLDSKILTNIMSIISKAKDGLGNGDTITVRKEYLEALEAIPQEIKSKIVELGIPIDKLENTLRVNTNVKGLGVSTDSASQKKFLKTVMANTARNTELISGENFNQVLTKYADTGLPLKYSKSQFMSEMRVLLDALSPSEQAQILKQLGINLNDDDFTGFVKSENIDSLKFSTESRVTVEEIKKLVDKFIYNNEIMLSDPEMKAFFDDLIQGLPEFISVIGSKNGYNNTLDCHTLKVLHNALSDPAYNKLSNSDKTVLKFSILLHDLGKNSGNYEQDGHSAISAIYAKSILGKFNLGQNVEERILNIVRHHHFSQENDYGLRDYFRITEDRNIVKILATADAKEAGHNLDIEVSKTWKRALPITRSYAPKYESFEKHKRIIDGVEYEFRGDKISDMPDVLEGLHQGYLPGTKKDDIVVQIHSSNHLKDIENIVTSYDDPIYDMVIQTSIRKLDNTNNGYGIYSAVLSTGDINVGGGNFNNTTSSGYEHDFKFFIKEGLREEPINIPKQLEYRRDARDIVNFVSEVDTPELLKDTEINGKHYSKEELKEVWDLTIDEINKVKSERYSLNPKVSAVVVHVDSWDKVPDEAVLFSIKYKIPLHID